MYVIMCVCLFCVCVCVCVCVCLEVFEDFELIGLINREILVKVRILNHDVKTNTFPFKTIS